MPLGPTIDRRVLNLGSDVGRHAQAPTFGDEAPRVITLVGTEREATLGARIMSLYHGECGLALGPARCPRGGGLDPAARRSRLWLGSSSGSPMPRRAYRRPRNGRSTAAASPRGEQERRP